jgi:nicotinamide-nucleotide amidase
VAGPTGPATVRALQLSGDRPTIRAATVRAVLELLAERLDQTSA